MNTQQARHQVAPALRLAITMAAAGIVVAACGGESSTPSEDVGTPTSTSPFVVPTETTSRMPGTPPSTPLAAPSALPPQVAGVDRQSPDAVAHAVAEVWYSWDTTVDVSPYDARVRAVPLLDDRLAKSILSFPPISGPGADWLELTAHDARLTVGPDDVRPASETGAPADTSTSAARLLTVTQKVTTDEGAQPDRSIVVAIVLTHGADGWRVSQVAPR
ncbi:hypothetical protein OPAG_08325 [Rhodococcus opacus PD630]|uniref:hypothetical protein n=1 Tax=Rhodococcus opacus TaxID=37919 RepID=UPI00029CB9F1|nr:hypothetical protein [Rhodococcus opacus]EHI39057.1 hypothetical protein OPAG_08325 [Rhodococcus opacus PD630]UDH01781.1 hypothetical protein K2Z90_008241 [Rhodococcus opacus PD630]